MHATSSKRVLLVDDSREFRKAAGRFIGSVPGLALVGEATCGQRALELTAALRPHLVLMDFAMPGMTGVAATVAIKRQPDPPKVIIITLHSQAEFRLMSKAAGADAFLLKDDLFEGLPPLIAALFPPDGASRGEPDCLG